MTKVYVVQDQKQRDRVTGDLRSKFNFSDAERFGKIEYLLRQGASPFELNPVIRQLHEVLSGYRGEDWLLLTGNPVLIGLSVAIASHYSGGRLRLLQWSGSQGAYIPVHEPDCLLLRARG